MIITRTPFRITLGGGGTDLPSYYSQYGGFVFSVAINKYMFINVNRPVVDELVRVKYTKSEIVKHRDELQHELAKEALRIAGIENSIEIISLADVPAGAGLGSSSCYTVGLLNALHALKRDYVSLQNLAEEACHVEIDLLKRPIGKQDQYMATFGGLTALEIDKSGKVKVRPVAVSGTILDDLQRNILLFYTGTTHEQLEILADQSRSTLEKKAPVVDSLHSIKEIGYKIEEAIVSGNLTQVGHLFDKHWKLKKTLSDKISNSSFDKIYDLARENGALGGKISGAGGAGFFCFYVESHHKRVRETMAKIGLKEMRFRFNFEGSKVIANFVNETM